MVTMREAVKEYRKRYYGDNSLEELKEIGGAITGLPGKSEETRADHHDLFHVIASGVAELIKPEETVGSALKFMDENGLVSRSAGIKAEIISDIYSNVIMGNVKTVDDFNNERADRVFSKGRFGELLSLAKNELKSKNTSGEPLSNIPELAKLKSSYGSVQNANQIIGGVISTEEMQFHVRKAVELNKKLRDSYPEIICKSNKDMHVQMGIDEHIKDIVSDEYLESGEYTAPKFIDEDKLLDLPLEAFKIDNLRALEKVKLKGRTGDLPPF